MASKSIMEEQDQIKVNNQKLIRRCSGYRTTMFVKIYELTIYTEELFNEIDDIFESSNGFLIEMKFMMDLPNDKIKQSMYDGFYKNSSESDIELIKDDIIKFLSIFEDVTIEKNNLLCINYDSTYINVRLTTKNGIKTITINNNQFKNPLLKIWLGNKPVDKHLRNTIIRGLTC